MVGVFSRDPPFSKEFVRFTGFTTVSETKYLNNKEEQYGRRTVFLSGKKQFCQFPFLIFLATFTRETAIESRLKPNIEKYK